MGFEYGKNLYKETLQPNYTDDLLDSIHERKEDLKIDIEKELNVLHELLLDIEKDHVKACEKLDSISDWDSDEALEADEACFDLKQKASCIEDLIDYLEDLEAKLN